MDEGKVTIQIASDLYEKVKRRVESSKNEFKTVEEYVEFILREVMKEENEPEQAYTPQEEKEVKERLRDLGYL